MFGFLVDRKPTFGLLLFLAPALAWSQGWVLNDAYLIQPTLIDPTYAGTSEYLYTSALQQKWAGFDGAPRSGYFTWDGVTPQYGWQIGVLSESTGPLVRNSPHATISVPIRLGSSQKLYLAMRGQIDSWGLDLTNLRRQPGVDPVVAQQSGITLGANLGFGLRYQWSDRFYFGFSRLGLAQWLPKNFGAVPSTQFIFGGIEWNTSVRQRFQLAWTVGNLAGSPTDLNLHAIWKRRNLGNLALSVSPGDQVGVALSTAEGKPYKVLYSYQLNTSSLNKASFGSHTLGIQFGLSKKPCTLEEQRYL